MNSDKKVALFFWLSGWCVAYPIVLKLVDAARPAPGLPRVGLAALNGWFRDLRHFDEATGYSEFWYVFTQVIGYLALAVSIFWAGIGLVQWVREKSLDRVDKSIFVTCCLYIAALLVFVVFNALVVNKGPVVTPGDAESSASFPSPYTMLVVISMGSTMYLTGYFLEKKEKLVLVLRVLCGAVMIAGVVGRAISGVCWLTDILGGILYSTTLLLLYSVFCDV